MEKKSKRDEKIGKNTCKLVKTEKTWIKVRTE